MKIEHDLSAKYIFLPRIHPRCTGWTVLSSSGSLGCGPVEPLGGVSGCLLASPGGGERLIAVRHSPQTLASVAVGRRRRRRGRTGSRKRKAEGDENGEDEEDMAWNDLPGR